MIHGVFVTIAVAEIQAPQAVMPTSADDNQYINTTENYSDSLNQP